MRLAACLVLLPSLLSAQQIEFDISPTADCTAGDGGMACVGLAANSCMESSPGGYSTNGMSICTELELDWWDERLNRNYQLMRERARAFDADTADYAPPQEEALKEMQRAWIPFRDAKCEFVATEWGAGTGAGPATIWCLMDETARQALYLEERSRN
jgi:uncharacterized protein YecT (DUF1311 family)